MNNRAELIPSKNGFKVLFIRGNTIVHEKVFTSIHHAAALVKMWEEESLTIQDLLEYEWD